MGRPHAAVGHQGMHWGQEAVQGREGGAALPRRLPGPVQSLYDKLHDSLACKATRMQKTLMHRRCIINCKDVAKGGSPPAAAVAPAQRC